MINKSQRTLIAVVITAFGIASSGAALAQSAYTTGTEASDMAAGYPSPYRHGSGPYAYTPGYGHAAQGRQPRDGSNSSIEAAH